MKNIGIFFIILGLSIFESCCSQRDVYINHKVLTTPLIGGAESKCITLNNSAIDSIVTRSSMELNTESPFTFIYLRSGKCIEKVGECIYHSKRPDSLFCILEPPCCAGNVYVYHWFKYYQQQDSLEQVSEVLVYTTTEIHKKDILWHTYPKQKEIPYMHLRSEPIINDTEEDEELRQIGNVIYEQYSENVLLYELGYNKKQPSWRICAIKNRDNNYYIIGWHNTRRK